MIKIAVCGYSSSVGQYFMKKYEKEFEFVRLGRKADADVITDLSQRTMSGKTDLLYGCQALINLATQTREDNLDEVEDMFSVNVMGAVFLAEIVRKYHIGQFLHMSSISATYGKDDRYYGFYAISKKSADEMLELYCKRNNICLCILRPTALFGDDSFSKHQVLLYHFIDKVKKHEPIQIYGKKDSRRNFIHISTLADVMKGVLTEQIEGVYNVVNQKNDSLTEMIAALNLFYHGDSTVEFLPDKPDVDECVFCDDSQIYRRLGLDIPNGFQKELIKTMH